MKSYKLRRSYTLLTVIFLALAYIANHLALAWVHDRVPKTWPLPDLLFSWTKEIPSAIFLAEYIMIFLLANGLIVIFFHQHKWIVVRRVFFCAGICYFTRAMAITLIQLPVPSRYTYCAPQTNGSLEIIVSRVLRICWSAGIEQLRSRVLCGDLIVSGHTISIFLSLLALQEYSPRKISALSYLYSILAYIALCCILLARKHYTIDVVLGYFLATRTFWTYHSLQYSFHLGQLDKNPMNNVIWAWMIPFLESDAPSPGIFSNALIWPSSCPSRFRRDSMHQVNA
ncbi:sphingomyelin synthase-related 2 [Ditylenchus destructor]|nr:sphingomyelin synthase-related 2 [Ditylenchus destructor]